MEIAVIGTGYVGLVTGVCLAEIGHKVTCIDIDEEKIAVLNSGKSPIYENGLEELLVKNLSNHHLTFTSEYADGFCGADVIYIAVGTPKNDDGSADLRFIDSACDAIAKHLKQNAVIVTKSTVPVGCNDYIKQRIVPRMPNVTIEVVSNPEFLKQGTAVHDTFFSDRIVIGSDSKQALELVATINEPFHNPIVKTDLRSAELIKYASNAFLATKISFINEMANLCEKIGANIDEVAKGMGMDKRIGEAFLNAGTGYGGSCFPKDTNAILSIAKEHDVDLDIINKTIVANERQRGILVEKILEEFGDIKGKHIAILGLSFKPNTDDMREAPSIVVIEKLLARGAQIHAYDPVAMKNAKKVLPEEVNYYDNVDKTIKDADMALILSDWDEIKMFPIEKYGQLMKSPILFDGRNCLSTEEVSGSGVTYHSIGRNTIRQTVPAELLMVH